jgi:hypothetical protein
MSPRDPADYAPVESDLPALLIEGAMDPITPPPLAKAILPGFANATYVEFPYAGHGPSRSVECAGQMLNAFFDDPTAEPDLSCVDEMEVPEFHAPLFTTSFGPRVAVKALEDRKRLVGPGLWLATSVLIPLIGLLVLTFAPLFRRLDRRIAVHASWARLSAWLAALLVVASVVILGSAIMVTAKSFELVLLLGLVPWARVGAMAGLLAGVAGLTTIVETVRAQRRCRLPVATVLGFLLTGVAAVSYALFLIWFDLGPF